MHFPVAAIISVLAVGAAATPLSRNGGGQPRICNGLPVNGGGCILYVPGFDVTGVVTEVDLTFPEVKSECDCIQECLNRPTTCASYVFKFSSSDSVKSGHRTCTLYSDFVLPSKVTLQFDLKSRNNENINADAIMALGNNPHVGSTVPQAFQDVDLSSNPDDKAISGPVWQLSTGDVLC